MELKIGDKVVWMKRIPGGDYVYPAQAKVIRFTDKQVKIEINDDGKIGTRYVYPKSLQKR